MSRLAGHSARQPWLAAGLLLLLTACGSTPQSGLYVVRSGDTLYSIAQRHNTDYRQLAAVNNLNYPYRINPGQRLRIPDSQSASAQPAHHTVVRGDTLYSIAWRYGLDYRQLAAANGLRQPYTIYPGQRLRIPAATAVASAPARPAPASAPASRTPASPASTAPVASKPAATPSRPAPAPSKPLPASSGPWQWPAQGAVIGRFSTTGKVNKGIDIAGQRGQPVQSARAGRVVYAGTGIAGYGRLLIIKHDEVFLSAYAHNERLLVAEGEDVRAGQKIAEMGDSGTSQVMLHFEIRRDGSPVDPLRLLPAR